MQNPHVDYLSAVKTTSMKTTVKEEPTAVDALDQGLFKITPH
jgi:hypothetical protein